MIFRQYIYIYIFTVTIFMAIIILQSMTGWRKTKFECRLVPIYWLTWKVGDIAILYPVSCFNYEFYPGRWLFASVQWCDPIVKFWCWVSEWIIFFFLFFRTPHVCPNKEPDGTAEFYETEVSQSVHRIQLSTLMKSSIDVLLHTTSILDPRMKVCGCVCVWKRQGSGEIQSFLLFY